MECNCGTIMELEENDIYFKDTDKHLELKEQFWCPNCGRVCTRISLYQYVSDYIEEET